MYVCVCVCVCSIPGVWGRLKKLGSIEDRYDKAISNVSGQLNSFVVDTVETGQVNTHTYTRTHTSVGPQWQFTIEHTNRQKICTSHKTMKKSPDGFTENVSN